jgi:large subunit ribosomal protein L13
MIAQRSTIPNVNEINEKWYVVDAQGLIVGRLAARVAKLVRGKMQADYTPHLNPKIHVVVINAEKAIFSGDKAKTKTYYRHSKYRTGLKETTPEKLLETNPTEILRKAIHGMLPKNRLGSVLNKNVRVYAGAEHPHEAQQPESLTIKTREIRAKD